MPIRSSGSACAAKLGVGLTASVCAGALTVGLTATFAIGLAFLGETRWRGAFFGGFFLIVLVFLPAVAFLRVLALVTGVFVRLVFPLGFAFLLVATTTSLNAHLY